MTSLRANSPRVWEFRVAGDDRRASNPWCSVRARSLRLPPVRCPSASIAPPTSRSPRASIPPMSLVGAMPTPSRRSRDRTKGRRSPPLASPGRDLDARDGLRDGVPWRCRADADDVDARRTRLVLDDIPGPCAEPTDAYRVDPHLGRVPACRTPSRTSRPADWPRLARKRGFEHCARRTARSGTSSGRAGSRSTEPMPVGRRSPMPARTTY